MPGREIVRMAAAVAIGIVAIVFLWQGWKNFPPARERLTSLGVLARDFGTVDIRSSGTRSFGGGSLVTDQLVVTTPSHGRVALIPPRGIALRDPGRVSETAPLTVLADLGGGRFYHVEGAGQVLLAYDEAAPRARFAALIAFGIGAAGLAWAGSIARSSIRRRGLQ